MEITKNSIITFDTNCFIYYFEDSESYAPKLETVFSQTQDGQLQACVFQVVQKHLF
jgi:hypothetical protein